MFKQVVIIGANGGMGAKTAAIIASFGDIPVYMVARTTEKANEGIEIAVKSVRSNIIRKNLIASTYSDLPQILKKTDWVIEAVSEDYEIKKTINQLISKTKKKNRIISTLTSGLSITKLSEFFEDYDRAHYMGVHFFNPPYKMLLCEVIPTEFTDRRKFADLSKYLEQILLRKVVETNDAPAFLANRIGFQFINEAAHFAEKYKNKGGIAYIDTVLGRFTGRSMAPMQTLDLVGLDTHKAIVKNLLENTHDSAHDTFQLPQFIQDLITSGVLGNKSGTGLYMTKEINNKKTKFVYDIKTKRYIPFVSIHIPFVQSMQELIHTGEYNKAFDVLKETKNSDAEIVKYFMARYISYSFSLFGSVVNNREYIDLAMGYGFNWLPPSALVDLYGARDSIALIKHFHFDVPSILIEHEENNTKMYSQQKKLDYRSFIMI